jgi:tetratricopeptide (TPR) repeat protein
MIMRFLAILLLTLPAFGQDPPPAPPAAVVSKDKPKPAQPPDVAAFRAASRIKEPEKRIEALRKFLKDFPTSDDGYDARREIVLSTVKVSPATALAATKKLRKGLDAMDASDLYRALASDLLAAGTQKADAETAAREALRLLSYQKYASAMRREAKQEKDAPPSEAVMRARFDKRKAQASEALAAALQANGKTEEANAMFREALAVNPALSAAATALGENATKAGRTQEALDLFAQSFLTKPSAASRKRFDAAWLEAKGSPTGAVEFLNARYSAIFPPPPDPKPYQPGPARTSRVVLAEIYTGAGCGPCVGADLAFEEALKKYPRTDLAVVMYHENIPRPDPLANRATIQRYEWQAKKGVPTYFVDGKLVPYGGGPRDSVGEIAERLLPAIDKELDSAPGAKLSLRAANDGKKVSVSAEVSGVEQPSPTLVLTVALVEKDVVYSGENGIRFHPMVVRDLATFEMKDEKARSASQVFELDKVTAAINEHLDAFEQHDERHNPEGTFRFRERVAEIDPGDLAVVAFVQDTRTKHVLQAAYADAPRKTQ